MQKLRHCVLMIIALVLMFTVHDRSQKSSSISLQIDNAILQLINVWYPRTADTACGGFFPNWSYDWKKEDDSLKGIVTQARHTWSASKAALRFPENFDLHHTADIGFQFIKNAMWDDQFGGFYEFRNRTGKYHEANGFKSTKRLYGNAFAIYALTAYYELTDKKEALQLAENAFHWLEAHSRDSVYGGYFNQLSRDGTPLHLGNPSGNGWDSDYAGLKDYNSSIHILEAYTSLYHVWPDPGLRETLEDIIAMIRDRFITDQGYLHLFYHEDWTPVSYRDSCDAARSNNFYLDHVSFRHDVETAYLLHEAGKFLELPPDPVFERMKRRLVDHAIQYGWDAEKGGLYEAAYYFKGDSIPTVIDRRKTWWVQAEALNVFLLMASLYPEDDRYKCCFEKQWQYIQKYLIDHRYGGWFETGPEHYRKNNRQRKAHHWKTSYHNLRALLNCSNRLASPAFSSW
ncbi:AGE family epimerase/isomerase [bacterium]|nr:AGE family epimerase/isomerase [bacterium]